MGKKAKETKTQTQVFEITEDKKDEIVAIMKDNLKLLLQLNINSRKITSMFANDLKTINVINSSIENSEYGLKKIDSIQNEEIILDFYSNLQKNVGEILANILSVVSGTFGSNRIYEEDTKLTQYKLEVTDNESQVQ